MSVIGCNTRGAHGFSQRLPAGHAELGAMESYVSLMEGAGGGLPSATEAACSLMALPKDPFAQSCCQSTHRLLYTNLEGACQLRLSASQPAFVTPPTEERGPIISF